MELLFQKGNSEPNIDLEHKLKKAKRGTTMGEMKRIHRKAKIEEALEGQDGRLMKTIHLYGEDLNQAGEE